MTEEEAVCESRRRGRRNTESSLLFFSDSWAVLIGHVQSLLYSRSYYRHDSHYNFFILP